MLHSLDLLIGFATIMAALSLVITVLTQIILDALQVRSGHLRDGLVEILSRTGMELNQARAIITASHLADRKQVTAAEFSAVAGGAVLPGLFDSVMQKASGRFSLTSRIIVATLAIILACGLPLDMLDLFHTLSAGAGVAVFPQSIAEWLTRWQHVNVEGIAGSAVLLSLGAPFWFEVLKDLLKLKGQ